MSDATQIMTSVESVDVIRVKKFHNFELRFSTKKKRFIVSGQLQRKWNGTGSSGSEIFTGKKSDSIASMSQSNRRFQSMEN